MLESFMIFTVMMPFQLLIFGTLMHNNTSPYLNFTNNHNNINNINNTRNNNTTNNTTNEPKKGFYSSLIRGQTHTDLSSLMSQACKPESAGRLPRQNTMPNMTSYVFEHHSRHLGSHTSPAVFGNFSFNSTPSAMSRTKQSNAINNNSNGNNNNNNNNNKNNTNINNMNNGNLKRTYDNMSTTAHTTASTQHQNFSGPTNKPSNNHSKLQRIDPPPQPTRLFQPQTKHHQAHAQVPLSMPTPQQNTQPSARSFQPPQQPHLQHSQLPPRSQLPQQQQEQQPNLPHQSSHMNTPQFKDISEDFDSVLSSSPYVVPLPSLPLPSSFPMQPSLPLPPPLLPFQNAASPVHSCALPATHQRSHTPRNNTPQTNISPQRNHTPSPNRPHNVFHNSTFNPPHSPHNNSVHNSSFNSFYNNHSYDNPHNLPQPPISLQHTPTSSLPRQPPPPSYNPPLQPPRDHNLSVPQIHLHLPLHPVPTPLVPPSYDTPSPSLPRPTCLLSHVPLPTMPTRVNDNQSRTSPVETAARDIRMFIEGLKSSNTIKEPPTRPHDTSGSRALIPLQQYEDTFDYGVLDEELEPMWQEEELMQEAQYLEQLQQQDEEILDDVQKTGEIVEFNDKYDDALATAGDLRWKEDSRIHETIFQASQEQQDDSNQAFWSPYYPPRSPEPVLTPSDDPLRELLMMPESPEEPQTSPEEQILHTPSRTCPNFLKTFLGDMQFDTRFALDRIISLGYLGWDEVTPEFLQILKRQPNINAAQQKMRELASKVNTKVGKVFDDAKDGKTFNSRKAKDQARVLRAEVSIDKIQFYYMLHNQNKLIRKFGGDCVMRVKFASIKNDFLRGRAMRQALLVFQRGIEVAGRRYQYVSPFSSICKGGIGGYFLATSGAGVTHGYTPRDVQSWMGCFKSINPFSKRLARLSQSLGKVIPTLRLQHDQMEEIDDIELVADDVKMNFTDGCGFIAHDLALQIWDLLKEKCADTPEKYIPSVFQVRIGGIKGLLLVTKMISNKIQYRTSMYKHDLSNDDDLHYTLDVLNFSTPGHQATLNRDFIQILYDNGVPFEVFQALLQQRYSELDSIMTNSDALRRIFHLKVTKDSANSEGGAPEDYFNFNNRIILDMLLAGVSLNEPVLRDKTNEWRVNKTKKFQAKFHIPVPNSRYVYGACDPSGTIIVGADGVRRVEGLIPAGKVFIQFSGGTSAHCGLVLIMRSPATAPWDIQVFQAVYIPELSDYKDVLLFSVKSRRPDCDILAGGDLDGDQYLVIWDSSIVNSFTPFAPPSLQPKAPSLNDCNLEVDLCDEIPRQITYLVSKMFYFELQKISKMHTKVADIYSTTSELAIALSKAHAMATDEDKTGIKPWVPSHIKIILNRMSKIKLTPHFKSKNKYFGTYHSTGILGRVYDALSARLDEVDINCKNIVIDEELLSPGYDCFIPLANEFLDCIQQELCEAYDKSSQNAVSMAKVKQTVFANSNTIFERMATQAEIGHESYKFSSAIYYVSYTQTIRRKEVKGTKLTKIHEYPWLCERVRRDLVFMKALQGERPGVRPSSVANSVMRSLFSAKHS